MIPAYIHDAIPVNFREDGALSTEATEAMIARWKRYRAFFKLVKSLPINYVILEHGSMLTRIVSARPDYFDPIFENEQYRVYRTEASVFTTPLRDILRW